MNSLQLFLWLSNSAHMLLKLEKCIPKSHVTLEMVPKYENIERQAIWRFQAG